MRGYDDDVVVVDSVLNGLGRRPGRPAPGLTGHDSCRSELPGAGPAILWPGLALPGLPEHAWLMRVVQEWSRQVQAVQAYVRKTLV